MLDLSRFPATQNLIADRFFVRAFAVTTPTNLPCVFARTEACLRRYAFTNPIWAIEDTYACSAEAALDKEPPAASCNAPTEISRRELPVSFTATATDACPARVEVGSVECDAPGTPSVPGVPGRPGPGRCRVTTDGDTLTIGRGTRVGTFVRWVATAIDTAGNTTSAVCETEMVRPQ